MRNQILMRNKYLFDFSGVTDWHSKGIKGKGVKIGIIDNSGFDSRPYLRNIGIKFHEPFADNQDKPDYHMQRVLDVNFQIAPEAEYYCFQYKDGDNYA